MNTQVHRGIQVLPRQPHIFISYFRVGRLLYYSLVLFILESWVYGIQLEKAWRGGSTVWYIILGFLFFLFSFLHIYLVIMDGWSRFQNYKRAKDQFYEHGFEPRIAKMYLRSKCQRNAALEAAAELGIRDDLEEYFDQQGVKWYHYVPYFIWQDPLIFLKRDFWDRTFLEKNYAPKYEYKQLCFEQYSEVELITSRG